jgi:hypothetical protein
VTAFRQRRPELAAATDALIAAGLTNLAGRGAGWQTRRPGCWPPPGWSAPASQGMRGA